MLLVFTNFVTCYFGIDGNKKPNNVRNILIKL